MKRMTRIKVNFILLCKLLTLCLFLYFFTSLPEGTHTQEVESVHIIWLPGITTIAIASKFHKAVVPEVD